MTSGKIKAVLFIIIVLLIVAVVASWFVNREEAARAEAEEAARAAAAAAVTPAPTPVPTPEPTAVLINPQPTPAPTPRPTPAPTPAPTPTPAPLFDVPEVNADPSYYGSTLAAGSFSSSYGLGIDLVADYTVTALNADEVSVTVTVSVQSGALQSGEMLLDISAGGKFVTVHANSVSYDDMSISRHPLGSQTLTVAAPAAQTSSIPVQAVWHFAGTYGGTSLPELECGGTISVTR